MAEKKLGRVIYQKSISPLLEIIRLAPEEGSRFPEYKAGQYIALSRDDCRLTRKVPEPDGSISYVYDLDEHGYPKRGPVTHSYSISSAPVETREKGYLEFYIVLELMKIEFPGRLSESLFKVDPESDNRVYYMNKITGDFTLEKRAAGHRNVVMVGTGTGLAPFASMIKQLYADAVDGARPSARFTLFHANRTFRELAYSSVLRSIEASGRLDFVYVPSVSRPIPADAEDRRLGKGRANNILRSIFGMPLKEEEMVREASKAGKDTARAEKILARTVAPVLPENHSRNELLDRMDPSETVILTCGSPGVMEDIALIAASNKIRFEKEEW